MEIGEGKVNNRGPVYQETAGNMLWWYLFEDKENLWKIVKEIELWK